MRPAALPASRRADAPRRLQPRAGARAPLPERPHPAGVRARRPGQRVQDVASMPGVQRMTLDRLLSGRRGMRRASASRCWRCSRCIEPALKTPDGARGAEPRRPGAARRARAEEALPRARRDDRRRARPVHQRTARTACSTTTGYIVNDDDRRGARAAGAGAGRGRRRHRRAERHDGRPHRRDPRRARGSRPHPHADHGLQRQVRERLLRPVPRRRRLGRQPRQEQQEGLPDGPGQQRRGAARGRRSTSPRAPTW